MTYTNLIFKYYFSFLKQKLFFEKHIQILNLFLKVSKNKNKIVHANYICVS